MQSNDDSSATEQKGIVYLVGAGSGDPDLITLRGAKLLESAQVVIYDYLANPQLLNHAPGAEQIYVGKQAAKHAMSQEQINDLLVAQGRLGRRVVRLKGGDPFVFGRGGEECEALRAAGVAFEVVPGITAAIAAPCYAGIPVTHRDLNSTFTLVTGHARDDGPSTLDWATLAKLPCLAFYMGVEALPRIMAHLLENGMNPLMPAAAIEWGTTPRQRTVVGTISDLPARAKEAKLSPPSMIIVGQVIERRSAINWFETRPLFGQTVIVTRTRLQASDLNQRLSELGAQTVEAPTIELVPHDEPELVDAALKQASKYDWIIFTSASGVDFARKRLFELGLDARALGAAKIAAIGDATAAAIRERLCVNVSLCPESFVAEALADALAKSGEIAGKRLLLLRADIARPILRTRLEEQGAAEVSDVPIYKTRRPTSLPPHVMELIDGGKVNWVTFTSSSTARNFCELLGSDYKTKLSDVKLASIGPITSATIRELGLEPTIEAKRYTVEGLAEAIFTASTK